VKYYDDQIKGDEMSGTTDRGGEQLERPRHRLEHNIKIDLKAIE
jgi:hypothetical protein